MHGILLSLALAAPPADVPAALDGEAIAAIWQKRHDAVKTARTDLEEFHRIPKGSKSEWLRGTEDLPPNAPLSPKADYEGTVTGRFLLDGEMIRYERESPEADLKTGEMMICRMIEAFNGKQERSLAYTPGWRPDARILNQNYYSMPQFAGTRAPLMAFRGRNRHLAGVPIAGAVATGRRADINGVACIEYLVNQFDGGKAKVHMWLAPARDWCTVREVYENSVTKTIRRTDVRHAPHPVVGWVPVEWEYSSVRRGDSQGTHKMTAKGWVINEPIPASEFTPDLPPGMDVTDDSPNGAIGRIKRDGKFQPMVASREQQIPGVPSATPNHV